MTSTQSGTSHPVTPVTGLPPLVTLKKPKASTHVPVYMFFSKTGWTLSSQGSGEVQTVGSTNAQIIAYELCYYILQFLKNWVSSFATCYHPWQLLCLGVLPSLQALKIHLSNWELDSISRILVSPSEGWKTEKTTLPITQCLIASPC